MVPKYKVGDILRKSDALGVSTHAWYEVIDVFAGPFGQYVLKDVGCISVEAADAWMVRVSGLDVMLNHVPDT